MGCLVFGIVFVGVFAFEALIQAFHFELAAVVAIATIAALVWLKQGHKAKA